MMKKLLLTTALIAGFGASAANAATISSILPAGTTFLSDESAEAVYDKDGNFKVPVLNTTTGFFEVTVVEGDILRGILDISDIDGFGIGVGSGNSELTAIFETEVVDIIGNGGVAGDDLTAAFALCGNAFCYEFGPTGTFAPTGFAANSLAMIAFYEDTTPDFDNQLGDILTEAAATTAANIATMTALASDGDAFWLFGVDTAMDDFWFSFGAVDTISIGASGQNIVGFDTSLSLLENPFGPDLNTFTCVKNFAGTLGTKIDTTSEACAGGGVDTFTAPTTSSFPLINDTSFTISVVPEPASLGLLGLGLMGIGFAARRRK